AVGVARIHSARIAVITIDRRMLANPAHARVDRAGIAVIALTVAGAGSCALHLERADVDAAVNDAREAGAALVEVRWRSEVRIARVYGRAAWQQSVRECRPAIVLQRAEQRIGIADVA